MFFTATLTPRRKQTHEKIVFDLIALAAAVLAFIELYHLIAEPTRATFAMSALARNVCSS